MSTQFEVGQTAVVKDLMGLDGWARKYNIRSGDYVTIKKILSDDFNPEHDMIIPLGVDEIDGIYAYRFVPVKVTEKEVDINKLFAEEDVKQLALDAQAIVNYLVNADFNLSARLAELVDNLTQSLMSCGQIVRKAELESESSRIRQDIVALKEELAEVVKELAEL